MHPDYGSLFHTGFFDANANERQDGNDTKDTLVYDLITA